MAVSYGGPLQSDEAFDECFECSISFPHSFGTHTPLPSNLFVGTDFFGIIKHLLDLTSSNIRF